MRFAARMVVCSGTALMLVVLAPAAPPGGAPGHAFGGSISGPPPLGASGPAPVHASGSLIGSPYSGVSQRGNGTRAGFMPGGHVGGRSGRGAEGHGGQTYRGDRRSYRHSPSALFFAPYYYPSLDYESAPFDSGYDEGYAPGPDDSATEMMMQSQGQLGQQVRRLSSEIEQLREQQNQPSSPYVVSPPRAPADEQAQNAVPVTLVLNSGRALKVKDYAVMNGVVWDFTAQPVRKIAVSEVNIEASAKATRAEGGEFPDLSAASPPEN